MLHVTIPGRVWLNSRKTSHCAKLRWRPSERRRTSNTEFQHEQRSKHSSVSRALHRTTHFDAHN